MNWKVFGVGLVLAVVAAAGFLAHAAYEGEYFGHLILSRVALLLGLPVIGLSLLVRKLRFARRGPGTQGPTRTLAVLLAVAVFFVLLTPAVYYARPIAHWRSEQAKAGIGPTVEALNQFKAAQGRYPQTLDEARAAGTPIPEPTMAYDRFYFVGETGQSFRLALRSPEPFTSCVYDSAQGVWSDMKEGHR